MGWESNNTFQVLLVVGNVGGVFVYNATGQLVDSIAFQANVDPVTSSNKIGMTSYSPGLKFAQMVAGTLLLGSLNPATTITQSADIAFQDSVLANVQPSVEIDSPITNAGGRAIAALRLLGQSSDLSLPAQIVMAAVAGPNSVSTAFVEIQPPTGGAGLRIVSTVATPLLALRGSSGADSFTVDNSGKVAASSGQAAGQVVTVTNTTAAPTNGNVLLTAAASADRALAMNVTGDTVNRLVAAPGNVNGTFAEGSGSAPQDTLYGRIAANRFGIGTADVDVYTSGRGLRVAEGANAKQGTATLTAGTVTVANTSVTANSRIMLTAQDNNSTGALRISARTAGTSFTITSSNAADSGVVAFQMFEPG